jgi:hypothetical protein
MFKRVKVTATAPDVDFERLKTGLLAEVSSEIMPGLAIFLVYGGISTGTAAWSSVPPVN